MFGRHEIQSGARVTMFVIDPPSSSDFKVSLNLISIVHSDDALCCSTSCEVGRIGAYYPDFGDRDTDRGSGTCRALPRAPLCMNANKTTN